MAETNTTRVEFADDVDMHTPQLATEFLLLMFHVQGRLSNLLGAESREYDIGSSEAIALVALLDTPTPISGVARAAGIRPNGASVLVDRLLARQLVRRQRSRRDNRVVTVELTDAGRELAVTITNRITDQVRFALGGFSTAERDQFVSLLRRLANASRALPLSNLS